MQQPFIYSPQGIIVYFLYADSSGLTKIKLGRHDNPYITVGVIVHEKDYRPIEGRISEAKSMVLPGLDPCAWELHAYDIWNSRNFFDDRRMRVNRAKKMEIFSRITDLACELDITIVGVIMFKDKMADMYRSQTVMDYSWMFVAERFEHFLVQKPAETNNGLLFIDASQKNPESDIRRALQKAVKNGSNWQSIDHVIEHPIFVESHAHNLIQLADMIAYVMLKHYKGDSEFGELFELLKSRMYRYGGKLDGFGLKEFP